MGHFHRMRGCAGATRFKKQIRIFFEIGVCITHAHSAEYHELGAAYQYDVKYLHLHTLPS